MLASPPGEEALHMEEHIDLRHLLHPLFGRLQAVCYTKLGLLGVAVVAGHSAEGKLNKESNILGEELDEEDEADEWKKAEEENKELDEEDPSPSASPSVAKEHFLSVYFFR